MYVPRHFEEQRVEVMHELIRARPLATVVTNAADGLNANHIPLLLSESPARLGTLQGHVARGNPLLADLARGAECLAIFHGPDAYITPSWYPTKQETGKVVPTWNYAVVHAYGVMRAVEDTTWLRGLLERLTANNEAAFAKPWAVSDAPPDYVGKMMQAIVGVEMVVGRLVGKWKVSQNQPAQNRAGVIAGLQAADAPAGHAMASLVEARARKPE